jgi:replicative superfamily II helicase
MSQRFLIEVEHESDARACTEAVKVFLRTGSHFLTHADWGCKDGEHKAWMIVEVDSREEARSIVPSQFRAQAKVVLLNTFTMSEAERVQAHVGG